MAQLLERKRRTKARLHATDKTTFEVLRLLYVSFALMRTQANKYFVSAGLSGAVPEDNSKRIRQSYLLLGKMVENNVFR